MPLEPQIFLFALMNLSISYTTWVEEIQQSLSTLTIQSNILRNNIQINIGC